MIEFDHSLIDQVRHLTTAANVHIIKTLIACYEEAVQQHIDGQPYDFSFECALREFLRAQQTRSRPRLRKSFKRTLMAPAVLE